MDAPSVHQLRAALWQARLLDNDGSLDAEITAAHRVTATEGLYPAAALKEGHNLLVQAGLVVSRGGEAHATKALFALAGLDDETAIELLRRYWARAQRKSEAGMSIEDERSLIGSTGEEFVAQALRQDLDRSGRADIAAQVQRVSLIDDGLGYDIQAPTLNGHLRLIEVKASTAPRISSFSFFLSRNEYEVGLRRSADWSLVACRIHQAWSVDKAELLGWAPAVALRSYLPEDANGRWSEALVRLPRSVLTQGLPPSV